MEGIRGWAPRHCGEECMETVWTIALAMRATWLWYGEGQAGTEFLEQAIDCVRHRSGDGFLDHNYITGLNGGVLLGAGFEL